MSPTLRHTLASFFSLVAVGGLAMGVGREWYLLVVPLALLLASAFLIHRPSLAPQLLARAVWWANLALGTVLSTSTSGRERGSGAMLALATGAALLIAGRKQLGEASGAAGYVPAALRSMLMLLMIFALADAQTFLLFGSVGIIDGSTHLGRAWLMTGIGITYVIGFAGLYRLQVWGALLNAALSAFVLYLVSGTSMIEKSELGIFLGVLAVVHIVVAAPVALSALGGRQLPTMSPRVRGVITTAVIALLMLVSIGMWCRGPIWAY